MKTGGKVIGRLLFFFGLLLNPIVLGKLFSHNGSIESGAFLVLIIGFELLLVTLGIVISKSHNRLLHNFGLSIMSVIVVLASTIFADQVYGRLLMPETANLLFPAFSRAKHRTSEFKLDVRINNLGFRGANTTIKKTRKRVLVIGDSFTFGWGVEEDESWIQLLSEKYPDIEFLNLGQGGNHPGDYVRIAKIAIPLLKPDLVIISILQGNDLYQLMRVIEFEENGAEIASRNEAKEPEQDKFRRYIKTFFPNLMTRFSRKVSIQKAWVRDSSSLFSSLTEEQESKYQKLNENIRMQFETGLLNPSLIYESLHNPDMFSFSSDTSNSLCKTGIARLRDLVIELLEVTDKNHAELLVLSLPNRPYGFPNTLKPLSELGFNITVCDTLNANIPLQSALINIPASIITPSLGNSTANLFYKYDGHWNATGNRIFADQLTKQLDTNTTWKHLLTF